MRQINVKKIVIIFCSLGVAVCLSVFMPQVRWLIIKAVERSFLRRELANYVLWHRVLLELSIIGIVLFTLLPLLFYKLFVGNKEYPAPVIMYPDKYIKKLWANISYPVKITFASSMIIGLIVHLFMITNMFPNHDFHLVHNAHTLVTSGRWFLFIPQVLSTTLTLPWIAGILTILYISISSCFVIKCLNIKNSFYCILISGLMISFPTVTSTFLYITFTDLQISALPLACLAVYITQRFRYGFCVGFIFIAMSLGAYQAYFSVAAGLSVAILIIDIIQMNLSLKEILIKGGKLLCTMLFGMLAYFIIVKLTLTITGLGLSTYQGMNEMGNISLSILPGLIKRAYFGVIDFFIADHYGVHGVFIRYAFYAIIILSAFILLIIIIQKNLMKRKVHFLILALLVVLFPLAFNIVYLFNAAVVHSIMLYGMVLLPVAVIALMELLQDSIPHTETQFIFIFKRTTCWIISAFLTFFILNYGIVANKTYTKMYVLYEQDYAYSVALLTRIESVEGYKADIPILLYGIPAITINRSNIFNEALLTGVNTSIPTTNHVKKIMESFLGFGFNMKPVNSTDIEGYNLEEGLANMPLYPEQGSIKRIDDVILVKFSEY